MRLFYSPTSPYARKARVVARELTVQLEEVQVNPFAWDTDFGAVNPINRVPALELANGSVLFDSPVICEYLDVAGGSVLLPREGAARWAVLRLQALGDGRPGYRSSNPPTELPCTGARSARFSITWTKTYPR